MQTFVVAEDVAVADAPTTFGVPAWAGHSPPAPTSAAIVKRATAAGAACTGKASMQPAGQDLVGANIGNPSNRTRASGGAYTGAAVAVAQGLATFALAPDVAGSVRVPAACCSVYGYRPSPGFLGGPGAAPEGAGSAGGSSSEVMCVLGREPGTVTRVAEALGAPGVCA